MHQQPTNILFPIINKAHGGGTLAGVIGLLHTSPTKLSAEIAWVVVFPRFQRMYVTINAVGILLRYFLELPSAPQWPRLGFRCMQWTAHAANWALRVAAERMGFKGEGVLRWTYRLPVYLMCMLDKWLRQEQIASVKSTKEHEGGRAGGVAAGYR